MRGYPRLPVTDGTTGFLRGKTPNTIYAFQAGSMIEVERIEDTFARDFFRDPHQRRILQGSRARSYVSQTDKLIKLMNWYKLNFRHRGEDLQLAIEDITRESRPAQGWLGSDIPSVQATSYQDAVEKIASLASEGILQLRYGGGLPYKIDKSFNPTRL